MYMDMMKMIIIADLLKVIIGMVHNNVDSHGSVEVQGHVREVVGAVVMMDAKEQCFPCKLQDFFLIIENHLFHFQTTPLNI